MKKNSDTWLMLLYNLPAQPSTQRVYVWRKLKSCGVLYWQHSVCVLPARPGFREKFAQLKRDIEDRHGEATISTIQFPDSSEQESIVARFRQQADEEYQEFLGQCRDFGKQSHKNSRRLREGFCEIQRNRRGSQRAQLSKAKSASLTPRPFFFNIKLAMVFAIPHWENRRDCFHG